MANNWTLTPKLPTEIAFVGFPFDTLFNTGVTISGVVLSLSVYSGLPDTQAAMDAMIMGGGGSIAVDAATRVAAARIQNGKPGTTYALAAIATGNDGTKPSMTWYLPVIAVRGG